MTLPLGLTQQAASRTDTPTDVRTGTITAVTSRGVDVRYADGLIENAAHLTSYSPATGDTVVMVSFANSWTVLGRLVGPGTNTNYSGPGTGVTGAILDGMVLSGSGAVMVTSTGALVTVPRYGVTYYHPVNHWVKLEWSYSWFSTSANDALQVRLTETLGAFTAQVEETQGGGAVGNFSTKSIFIPPTLGGTVRAFGMQLQRVSGAGTSRIEDVAARRGGILVYDLGDASIIRTV
jgi:hypothetical protein